MPVRSFLSSVLKWPDKDAVDWSVRLWAERISRVRHDVLKIGYFGSYARGDWGVGSDIDLVVVTENEPPPPNQRTGEWDTTNLPVPCDLIVYSRARWEALADKQPEFYAQIAREAVWVYDKQ